MCRMGTEFYHEQATYGRLAPQVRTRAEQVRDGHTAKRFATARPEQTLPRAHSILGVIDTSSRNDAERQRG